MKRAMSLGLLITALGATAAPSQKFAVEGLYPGMPKAEAKKLGLGECTLEPASDAVVCVLLKPGMALAGVRVLEVRAEFKPPRRDRIDVLRYKLDVPHEAIKAAWRLQFGAPHYGEDYDTWEDGATWLQVCRGRRLPSLATVTYDLQREVSARQEKAEQARRKAVLKGF